MQYRKLGRTGWNVSTISFGAWAIGGTWGNVDDQESLAALHRAIDLGVNFFDTADVYGDGRSERLLAQLRKERSETIYVATKAGRRLDPHTAAGYNRQNLTAFVERSLKNLEHRRPLTCSNSTARPPRSITCRRLFGVLDDLVSAGKTALLRGERGKGGRSPQGDRVSRMCKRCRSFSIFSASARANCSSLKPCAARSASWRACRCPPAC